MVCPLFVQEDQGHRPGKLIALAPDALHVEVQHRLPADRVTGETTDSAQLDVLVALIRQHDATAYLQRMQHSLARHGLFRFVQDIVAPLTQQVALWVGGWLPRSGPPHAEAQIGKGNVRHPICHCERM